MTAFARRRWPVACAALGVLLVAGALIGLSRDRATPSSFGSLAAPAGSSATRSFSTTPSTSPVPVAAQPIPSATAARPTPTPHRLARPVQLRLPRLGVRALVVDVVTTEGVLGVPDDPRQVGWWTGSALPGSASGSTVLDGHVDSATRGAGALFDLGRLENGDPIEVSDRSGAVSTYRVTARQVLVKAQGLPASLFARDGAPRLVLITCGGPFDAATRHYRDNVVVLADPAPAAS
jgi:hypothetical protein